MDEALDLVRPLAAGHRRRGLARAVRSTVTTTASGPTAQRMIQILLNLVSNAVKYNRAGGSVRIGCEDVGGGMLAIRVTDTGPGLTEDQLSHVFEPFDRPRGRTDRCRGHRASGSR